MHIDGDNKKVDFPVISLKMRRRDTAWVPIHVF